MFKLSKIGFETLTLEERESRKLAAFQEELERLRVDKERDNEITESSPKLSSINQPQC